MFIYKKKERRLSGGTAHVAVNMNGKHFWFLARVVPKDYVRKEGKVLQADELDDNLRFWKEFNKEELQELDLGNLGLALDHNTLFTKGAFIKDSDDPERKQEFSLVGLEELFKRTLPSIFGRVVYKWQDEASHELYTVLEIAPEKNTETLEGAMRHHVKAQMIKMITSGYLADVSLCHGVAKAYDSSKDQMQLTKVPLELSVTRVGERTGSSIIWHGESDESFLRDHQYAPYDFRNNLAKSFIQYEDGPALPSDKTQNNVDIPSPAGEVLAKEEQEEPAMASAPSIPNLAQAAPVPINNLDTQIDAAAYKSAMAQLSTLQKQVAEMDKYKAVYDDVMRKKEEEDKIARKSIVTNGEKMMADTLAMIEFMQQNNLLPAETAAMMTKEVQPALLNGQKVYSESMNKFLFPENESEQTVQDVRASFGTGVNAIGEGIVACRQVMSTMAEVMKASATVKQQLEQSRAQTKSLVNMAVSSTANNQHASSPAGVTGQKRPADAGIVNLDKLAERRKQFKEKTQEDYPDNNNRR